MEWGISAMNRVRFMFKLTFFFVVVPLCRAQGKWMCRSSLGDCLRQRAETDWNENVRSLRYE